MDDVRTDTLEPAPVLDAPAFRLSPQQRRLWRLEREEGIPGLRARAAVRLDGPLEKGTLRAALDGIAARYEILRTVFPLLPGEDEPAQVVLDPAPGLLRLETASLADLPPDERTAALERLWEELTTRPLDPDHAPPLAFLLVTLAPDRHHLLIAAHPLCADASSLEILAGELRRTLSGFAGAEEPAQYPDLAEGFCTLLEAEETAAGRAFWRERLATLVSAGRLPLEREIQAGAPFLLQEIDVEIPDLFPPLPGAGGAMGEGGQGGEVLLTAWQALLIRLAGEEAGSTVAVLLDGRSDEELATALGPLARHVPVHLACPADEPFTRLVARTAAALAEAAERQDFLDPEAADAAPAAFGFSDLRRFERGGGERCEARLGRFRLSLSCFRHAGGLRAVLAWDGRRFREADARWLLDAWLALLRQAAAHPETPLAGLGWSGVETLRDLAAGGPAVALPEPFLHRLVADQARRDPAAPALLCGGEVLSYGELEARTNQLARHLRGFGVGPGVLVGLLAERSFDFVVGLLGILKAGGAFLPLDPAHPLERLASLLEDAGLALLVTQERLLDVLPSFPGFPILLDAGWDAVAGESPDPLEEAAAPDELAYLLYTSGSTGRPKGVQLAHRGLANLAVEQARLFRVGPGSRVLQIAAPSFDASVSEIAMALASGAALCLAPREDLLPGPDLARTLREMAVTTATLVPSALAVMPEEELPALATLVVAGEACPLGLAERWGTGRRLWNAYGPTETTVCATAGELAAGSGRLPVGRPLAGMETWVLGAGLEALPAGVPGELCVGGIGLARGYHGRPDLTAERFIPHPFWNRTDQTDRSDRWAGDNRLYRTGDLARWLPDGSLELLGRIDFQVKVRGVRVEPGEVEAALAAHPGVREVAVVKETAESRLAAFFVPREGGASTPAELRAWLRERLPETMVPAVFTPLRALPLTTSGKVDRRALAEWTEAERGAGPGDGREPEPPRTALEEILAGIWCELLGLPRAGRNESFFDLGGHSLLGTQLISRVRETLGVEITLAGLFERPTLAGVASLAAEAGEAGLAPPPILASRAPRPSGGIPLSFAQQRLWFLERMAPGNPYYNVFGAVLFRGPLDERAFAAACNELVRLHEILRTTFAEVDGQPVQLVAPRLALPLPVVDLAGLPAGRRRPEAERIALADARRPFDLARGPLVRLTLLRLALEERVLVSTLHHIVSDGWSMSVILRSLTAFYAAFAAGRFPAIIAITGPPVQYADFALWQRSWLAGAAEERQLAWWRQRLAGLASLELPTDRPRPPRPSYRGRTLSGTLDPALAAALQALARREKVTLFMALLAGFQALLSRLARQEDVAVGSPIANRERLELESMIGFFVNTLVMRTDLSGRPSGGALLARVRQTCLGAYAHQDLPFERLVEELQPQRDPSRQPLFQVMFQLQNVPSPAGSFASVTLEPLDLDPGTSQFDLRLDFFGGEAGLHWVAYCALDLFDVSTVHRWVDEYLVLLAGLAADSEAPVEELPLLSPAGRQQLLREWNDTVSLFPSEASLQELFEIAADRSPDAPAVSFDGGELTYGELDARANRLAWHLRELGVAAETPVAVCLDRSAALVVTLLAVLKAGGFYVPLDPEHPPERLARMLADSGAPVLVAGLGADVEAPSGVRRVDLIAEAEAVASRSASRPEPLAGGDHLAYAIYTSGSTGRPKGVAVPQRAVARLVLGTGYVRLGPADRVAQASNASFDAATFEIWGALLNGACLVGIPRDAALAPAALARRLREEGITVLFLTTALFNQVVREEPAAFATLRHLLFGGEAVDSGAVRAALAAGPPERLLHVYGPTESTTFATWHRVEQVPPGATTVPIGRPLANTRLHVLEPAGLPAPPGAPGELVLGGDGLARGYLGRPDLTAERFVPDPFADEPGGRLYRTGDLVRQRPVDGAVEFLGRLDRQVKIRGFRIEPGEVEAVLAEHPAVRGSVVSAAGSTSEDRRLAAWVALDPSAVEGEWEAEQVAGWEMVFDGIYRRGRQGRSEPADPDPTFNRVGWESSYTGLPLPREEMREWLDDTVERILSLEPRRVLEIGCGTGMILFRAAPACEHYVGTDLSAEALEYVRDVLAERGISGVDLEQRPAHRFDGFAAGSFDAVILNSVVQYFPDAGYLAEVVAGAARVVSPGGAIFIGDVRSLPLLEAFHATVELVQASDQMPVEVLRRGVGERLLHENELSLAPSFFFALSRRRPEIGRVEVHPKRGRARNELTAFRYQVVLRVGEGPTPEALPEVEWRDWRREGMTLPALRELLRSGEYEIVAFSRIPNARTAAAAAVVRLLRSPCGPATAGGLRRLAAAAAEAEPGIEPEDLRALAAGLPWEVELGAALPGSDGAFEAVFRRRPAQGPWPVPAVAVEEGGRHANQPLLGKLARRVFPELRRFLAARLPDHMVPAILVPVEAIPLTPNGKVDHAALPDPEPVRLAPEETFAAPRTPEEEILAGLFADLLGMEHVGIHDDFFALGGHSLLATRAISRIRRTFAVELELRALFEAPTVAGLAGRVRAALLGGMGEELPGIERVPRQGERPELPLSFGQQRLWFLHRLDPAGVAYNLPTALCLRGGLRPAALAAALSELVRRHEVLRSTYVTAAGSEVQSVQPPAPVPLPLADLSGLPPAARETEARRLTAQEAGRPFDLARGPVLRALLLRLAQREHAVALTLHHIAGDGWSMGVLTGEMAALYQAFAEGRPSPLLELAIQYGDFAVWQRRWLEGPVLPAQLAWWKQRLAGAPAVLPLPTDRPRPAVRRSGGARHRTVLPPSLAASLEGVARACGATLFMALAAAFQTLLARWTGERDVPLGTPIAGRRHLETEGLIGFFVNTLVLRVDLADDPSFRELLGRCRETVLGAFSHQDLPFERLVEELHPERSLSHTPLFQVLFALQRRASATGAARDLPGLLLEPLEVELAEGRFDLELQLGETGEGGRGLEAFWDYATALFDPSTVARLAASFQVLLEGIASAPEQPLSELPLLSTAEHHQILDWGRAPGVPALDVLRAFAARVAASPSATALVSAGEVLTFRELDERADRVARRLRVAGIGRGDVVALACDRGPDLPAALLGIWKAGGAFLPVDPTHPPARRAWVLEDSRARLLLTDDPSLAEGAPPGLLVHPLAADGSVPPLEILPTVETPRGASQEEDLAYVLYTSGSTGRPKGVMVEHRQLAHTLGAVQAAFGFTADDRMLCTAAASFDVFFFELLSPLLAGGVVVLLGLRPTLDVEEMARELENATVAHAVPAVMRQATEAARRRGAERYGRLRQVFVGGDAVPADLLAEMREAFPRARIRVLYGPTESTLFATACEVRSGEAPPRPLLGRPLPGCEVLVLDESGRPVPVGALGELVLGGPGVARGYLDRPDLTAERFLPDPFGDWTDRSDRSDRREGGDRLYRTGDLARYLPDGRIEFLGRADHQVKIRGVRIELGEVEFVLGRHPAVRECAVLVSPGGQRLAAWAALREPVEVADLLAWLRRELPAAMVPATLVVLDALPRTLTGKLDRAALPAPDAPRSAAEPAAPRDEVEESIAWIWRRLLEVERVGIHDGFFELGGHSLLATRVVAAVRDALGIELPLRTLFEAPTVAGLAAAVRQLQGAETGEGAGAIPRSIPRRARRSPPAEERFPVSLAQLEEWMFAQLDPDSPANNLPGAVRLQGPLDVGALRRAVRAVAGRHESLRTSFVFDAAAGEPVQVVTPGASLQVPLVDLSSLDGVRREALAGELAQAEADAPFDLAAGPLVRITLLRLGAEEHALLHTLHHIVSDGWSVGIFIREIWTLYEAFAAGRPSPLPELPVQYPDYAAWQRESLRGEALESRLRYWRVQLAGAPPRLDLPLDRPRPPVRTMRPGRLEVRLGAEASRALEALTRAGRATPFMGLLAALAALLSRLSGQDDLCVGTFASNRRRAELEGLIGFFVETLALRIDLSGDPGLAGLLPRVREVVLGAFAHQDVPFERVLDALHLERDPGVTPLFQVLLGMHTFPQARLESGEVRVTSLPLAGARVNFFDLTFQMAEVRGEIAGSLDYNADLFDAATAESLARRLRLLIEAAVARPAVPVSELPLLSEEERRQLVAASAVPGGQAAPLVPERIAAQCRATPEAPALEQGGVRLTYSQLEDRVAALAGRLQALGVGPEDRVAVALERGPGLMVALLGALRAGAAYLPLDPAFPLERQAWMLEDAGASAIVTGELSPGLAGTALPSVRVAADGTVADFATVETPRGASPAASCGSLEMNGAAFVLYTSGSTGRPKGVVVEHRSLAAFTEAAVAGYGIVPGDRVLQFASVAFDTSAEEIFPCLAAGATLVLREEGMTASAAAFLAECGRLGITILNLPTAFWHELSAAVEAEGLAIPPSLRLVILGGEKALADRTALWLRHAPPGVRLVYTYGPTEATVVATRCDLGEEMRAAGEPLPDPPIGWPLPGAEAWVLDRRLEPVPAGVSGELFLGGSGLARGYLGRPDVTAERFVPHPFGPRGGRLYRTGDRARRRPDGALLFLGRTDLQIKLRGFRIEPGEIEAALHTHPAVREAVVGLIRGAGDVPRLAAWVVPEAGRSASAGNLRAFLAERLPDWMVPALFAEVEALPRTPTGKLDRRALPSPEAAAAAAYVPPGSELERAIAAVWLELLPVARVGLHDNFFEIGGDSLLLLSVHRRLREVLGGAAEGMPVVDLFRFPTVAALSRQLAGGSAPSAPDAGRIEDLAARQATAQARLRRAAQRTGRPGGRGGTPA